MTPTPAPPGAAPRVLLATRNQEKLAELRRILAPLLDVQVIGLDELSGLGLAAFPEVPETGATFADNALLKARDAYSHTGLLTVADDSGLTVDALNGMPGVLSARWAGPGHDDRANLELVLHQVADVPDDRLGAAFVCAVALVGRTGEQVVHGRMPGHLVRTPRGTGGFGYDPILLAEGHVRTSAELDPMEKDAVSHRGQAMRALAPVIAATLTD